MQDKTELTVERIQELINGIQTHSPELIPAILHMAKKGGIDISNITIPETEQQSQNEESEA